MTDSTSPSTNADAMAGSYQPPSTKTVRPESFASRVLRDTFRRWGARIGLAWVGSVFLLAVFAPVLANSMPLLAETPDRGVHSPVWDWAGAADITLFAAFVLLIAWFATGKRIRTGVKMLVFVGALLLTLILSLQFKDQPDDIPMYHEYRAMLASGEAEWVRNAPIAFSPRDTRRDRVDEAGLPLHNDLRDPDREHWLGTDRHGRDILSSLIHASRIALGIGFVAVGIAMFIGVIIGGLMGYFSGIVDMFGMRLVEVFEAIPSIFLLLTFVAFYGGDLYVIMVILGLLGWPGFARFTRAEFLKLRAQDYVQAGHALGLPLRSILFRHMLPNALAPILVTASFGIAGAILGETTLSFLGLTDENVASWGRLLNQAIQAGGLSWTLAIFPGLAIFLTVFSYNLIGESLRDAIDPYLKKSA